MSTAEEPEIATRAPENDASETQTAAEGTETKTEEPGLGEHCKTDRPTPAGAKPSGEVIKLDDIETYVSKPNDYPQTPCKLLMLLSSSVGVHSVNNQLQADAFAKEGFLVFMPDQFNKDPEPYDAELDKTKEEDLSVLEQVKLRAAKVAQGFMFDMWLARQTPEKVTPLLERAIKAAKIEFADALAAGGGLYAVGYCFGGKYVLRLANGVKTEGKQGSNETESEALKDDSPVIKAGAFAHGTLVNVQEFDNVKAPLCIVAVENDQLFPADRLKAGQEKLEKSGVEHQITVYPDVPHGFAVVGDYDDEKIMEKQKEAHQQMLAWLKAH